MVKRRINKLFSIAFAISLLVNILSAQVISPFNKIALKDTSSVYSFIVSGHFHGASTNVSTFPASTILSNLDTLNALHPLFLMSLGDMFLDVNETYIHNYKKSLFDKLKMPLFNAVGNHDVSNGNRYEKEYGSSYFTLKNGTELFIILNTEINDGSIKGDQFDFLVEAVRSAGNYKNIFIFSHRPIWAENNSRYKNLFIGNTRTEIGRNNFEDVVLPLLMNYSKVKHFYWISGSMAGGPASFFYDKDPVSTITYMQSAIRDQERDAVLQIFINKGVVRFNGISLTGQNLDAVENYNLSFWKNTISPEQKFNYRLLPYLTKQMLLHYYFWIGFVSSLVLFFSLRWVYKKWKRKK